MAKLAHGRQGCTAPRASLCLSSHFGPPPFGADEEESPVGEEFGWFALEGVS
jgi:hypothetical protein